MSTGIPRHAGEPAESGTGQVVSHVRALIERGALKPGDRLPAERDLATQNGFTREEMYEARRILEIGAAGLAAERASAEQVATLAEEVASLFASMHDPQVFLVHDINFHRGVAAASHNPIIASLVEMVSALYYERRRETAARASERDLRDAAEAHRRIYQAIRARDAAAASRAMHDHLLQASRYQAQEPAAEGQPAAPVVSKRRPPSRRRPNPANR
jgi:GntR family transcriptional repressor for pyruvate dehydrogenase complex